MEQDTNFDSTEERKEIALSRIESEDVLFAAFELAALDINMHTNPYNDGYVRSVEILEMFRHAPHDDKRFALSYLELCWEKASLKARELGFIKDDYNKNFLGEFEGLCLMRSAELHAPHLLEAQP